MANLATVMREETCRLARKELKPLILSAKRTTAQHRREIAALKRRLSEVEKKLVFLEGQERQRIARPRAAEDKVEAARFSARSVRSQRNRLKLSAEEFARLLGVSAQTVYLWEHGKTRPRAAQLAGLVAVRTLGRREARERLKVLTGNGAAIPRRGRKPKEEQKPAA